MEDNHLVSFEVSGFKKFTNLNIENISQFNLIVGDNNVGKTTLLESLLIDNDYKKFTKRLSDVMLFIKKFTFPNNHFFAYYFSNSFSSYPQKMKFTLRTKGNQIEIIEYDRTNTNRISTRDNNVFKNNIIDVESNAIFNYGHGSEFDITIPYIPFGTLYTHELTKQYSNSVQRFVDKKAKLLESLSYIIHDITNIEVSVGDSSQPLLLISEKNKNILLPIAYYGDGTIKLFRILLSLLANDSSDRLMIDELDAGVHYSHSKDFIKSLLQVAKEQKKQIFATTHSKECIEYFTTALKEAGLEKDGRIIRLADTKSGIKAYTHTFDQFESALNAESELR